MGWGAMNSCASQIAGVTFNAVPMRSVKQWDKRHCGHGFAPVGGRRGSASRRGPSSIHRNIGASDLRGGVA